MSEKITKVQRWLDLISYLVGRRVPVAVDEIMERVPAYAERWRTGDETDRATARRVFERDKAELREMGIPLETVTYTVNYGSEAVEGYRLARRDFYLPYLRVLQEGQKVRRPVPSAKGDPARIREIELSAEEARLAVDAFWYAAEVPSFPLAEEARSGLQKLGFDLGAEDVVGVPVIYAGAADADRRKLLRTLSDALLGGRRVRFTYHAIGRAETTERRVDPYGMFFRGDWYLVGHDERRNDRRVFRVSRMSDLAVVAGGGRDRQFAVPPDFRIEEYVDREPWELGDEAEPPMKVEVRFRFPQSAWADRNELGRLIVEENDGATVREFAVRQPDALVRWVLGMAGEAEITSPEALRRDFAVRAAKVAERHSDDSADA